MDREELEATLARFGRSSSRDHGERDERARPFLTLDPPAVLRPDGWGARPSRTFASEDEACRWWLANELQHQPLPDVPGTPLPRPGGPVTPSPGPGGAGWTWPVPSPGKLAARGSGIVVVHDATSLLAHGAGGASVLTALDAGTGRERWSVPVTGLPWEPDVAVLGEHVLLATPTELRGLAGADGRERWRAAVPWKPQRGRAAVLAHDGDRVLLATNRAAVRSRRAGSWSIDLRTGRICWGLGFTVAEPPVGVPPRLGRLLTAAVRDGELGVFAGSLRTTEMRLLTRTAAPSGFAGVRLTVRFDGLTRRGGFAVVRAVSADGRDRADAVVAAGSPAPAFASPGLEAIPGDTQVDGLDERRFVVRRGPQTTELRTLDGTGGWTRADVNGPCHPVRGGVVAPLGRTVEGAEACLIRDDGSEAWRRRGWPVAVRPDGVVVLEPEGALTRVDEVTGEPLGRAALPEPRTVLFGPRGCDPDDGCVVVDVADAVLGVVV